MEFTPNPDTRYELHVQRTSQDPVRSFYLPRVASERQGSVSLNKAVFGPSDENLEFSIITNREIGV